MRYTEKDPKKKNCIIQERKLETKLFAQPHATKAYSHSLMRMVEILVSLSSFTFYLVILRLTKYKTLYTFHLIA